MFPLEVTAACTSGNTQNDDSCNALFAVTSYNNTSSFTISKHKNTLHKNYLNVQTIVIIIIIIIINIIIMTMFMMQLSMAQTLPEFKLLIS